MAIRDQSYQRYDGPVRTGRSWPVIGWSEFRAYWRFWRTKLTIFAVWLLPLMYALLVLVEAALMEPGQLGADGPGHSHLNLFVSTQLFALALVYIARGCGIVSDDLRHGTLQLYFSKPIDRIDYMAGKFYTLVLLGVVSVFAPAVLLAGLRTAFFVQSDMLAEIVVLHLQTLVLLAIAIALLAAVVLGLSSLTRRTGWAVLGWIAILIVPLIVHAVGAVAADISPWDRLLSLHGLVGLAGDALMGGADAMPEWMPRIVPFAAIGALIGAGFAALNWRLSHLEKIT